MNPEDKAGQYYEKIDAVLRVALGLDPEELTDDLWAKRFQEWVYVQRMKQLSLDSTIRKIAHELFSSKSSVEHGGNS